MKVKEIELMFALNGVNVNLKLEPCEGESGLDALIKAVDYLVAKGAEPRPMPGKSFGGSNGGKAQQPLANDCPDCHAPIKSSNWTNKDNKAFTTYRCEKSEAHYKRTVLAKAS